MPSDASLPPTRRTGGSLAEVHVCSGPAAGDAVQHLLRKTKLQACRCKRPPLAPGASGQPVGSKRARQEAPAAEQPAARRAAAAEQKQAPQQPAWAACEHRMPSARVSTRGRGAAAERRSVSQFVASLNPAAAALAACQNLARGQQQQQQQAATHTHPAPQPSRLLAAPEPQQQPQDQHQPGSSPGVGIKQEEAPEDQLPELPIPFITSGRGPYSRLAAGLLQGKLPCRAAGYAPAAAW